MSVPEHLEELSTIERIKLVQTDSVRVWGQMIIAFVLIGGMVSYLAWYTIVESNDVFRLEMASDMKVLLIMGIGAALAIFGLGRTVGRKK